MFYIASTRFNNKTWKENNEYKQKHKLNGVLYGVTIKMHEKYPLGSLLFVVEMNNDTNQIEGIGLIRNNIGLDKRHYIYQDDNYNRFTYKGNYWLSKQVLEENNRRLVEILETMMFKGKSHLKRQSGISVVTQKLYSRWQFDEVWVKESLKKIFIEKCIVSEF